MAHKKKFLEENRTELIQKTRNPVELSDTLLAKKFITDEIYSKIKAKETDQDKMREIFGCLNSACHFKHMFTWLEKNEPDLLKELKTQDIDAATPHKKRARLENVDEMDINITETPGLSLSESETDLRKISTFSQLEDWISNPENSRNLCSYLEQRIGDDGMVTLRSHLKKHEPKNSLIFNAEDIDQIRRNRDLETFLNATQKTQFPKLTFLKFFKKRGSASSENKARSSGDHDESMDTTTDFSSSGHGSLLSSSLNDSFSQTNFTVFRETRDMDIMITDNKDHDIEAKTTEQLCGGSFLQMDYEGGADAASHMDIQDTHTDEIRQNEQFTNIQTPEDGRQTSNGTNDSRHEQTEQFSNKETPPDDESFKGDMQDAHSEETHEEPQGSLGPNDSTFEAVTLHQNERVFKKEALPEDELIRTAVKDTHTVEIHEEAQRSYGPIVSSQKSLHQNDPVPKKEPPVDDATERTDMQDTDFDETHEEPQGSHGQNDSTFEAVTLHQNERVFKKEAPPEDELIRTAVKDTHTVEIHEEAQRSYGPIVSSQKSLHQNDPVPKKEPPVDDATERTDMQDTDSDEIHKEPLRSHGPNDSVCKDASLQQNERKFTNKETPPKDGPQTSIGPNNSRHEDVSLEQNKHFKNKETTPDDGPGRVGMQDTHRVESDEDPQGSHGQNDSVCKDVSLEQNNQLTEIETPPEDGPGRGDLQNTQTDEIHDVPQRSHGPNILVQVEPVTKKETPQEHNPGRTDMKYDEIDEEPQGSHGPNDSTCEDMSLDQNEQLTKKETPSEDEPGRGDLQHTHSDELNEEPKASIYPHDLVCEDVTLQTGAGKGVTQEEMQDTHTDDVYEEPQRYHGPNDSRCEDVFLQQNESFINIETPPKDLLERIDMQDTHKIYKEPQRSNGPNDSMHEDVPMDQNESDRCGNMIMQQYEHEDGQVNPEPFSSKQLQKSSSGLVSASTHSYGTTEQLHGRSFSQMQHEDKVDAPSEEPMDILDTHTDEAKNQSQRSNVSKFEDVCLNQNERFTNIQTLKHQPQRSNGPNDSLYEDVSLDRNESDRCGDMTMQQNEHEDMQVNPESLTSMQLHRSSSGLESEFTEILAQKKCLEATKKRERAKSQRHKKKKDKDTLLRDWALRQCNNREDELRNILEQISIRNLVEHRVYPCFTAENIMVYKSKIIFIATDNTSINTKTMVQYCMFVCNIKKAILLGPKEPKEQEIRFDETKVPVDKCSKFVFKVFAPTLAVFKTIQKEEQLYSLIS